MWFWLGSLGTPVLIIMNRQETKPWVHKTRGGGVGTEVHSKVRALKCLPVQWKFSKERNISSVKGKNKKAECLCLDSGWKSKGVP